MNAFKLAPFHYLSILALSLVFALFITGCTVRSGNADHHQATQIQVEPTNYNDVAKYIHEHHQLPPNYITKKKARMLGWDARSGNLNEVAPGKSIGGDVFRNNENQLPDKAGRIWREADIGYKGGRRGAQRILYSNDGLIYKTTNHYKTFTQIEVE